MIFDLSKGNKPGIENILKTGSTEREESKEELSQPESFSLKLVFFFFSSVEKQVRSIQS